MKRLNKYRSHFFYIVFGIATTVLNIIMYWFFASVCHWDMISANVVAGLLAIAFACVTNKLWVFESKVHDFRGVAREVAAFYACRIATGVLDMGIMFIGIEILRINDVAVKCVANGVVIISNYVASKKVVFKTL